MRVIYRSSAVTAPEPYKPSPDRIATLKIFLASLKAKRGNLGQDVYERAAQGLIRAFNLPPGEKGAGVDSGNSWSNVVRGQDTPEGAEFWRTIRSS